MSINWVMLSDTQTFVRLPGEKPLHKSDRIALSINTPRAYPAQNPFTINSNAGTVYLTNQRVVYLPTKPTADFKSFSASLLNLHDTHLVMPWFGPNQWQAHVQPVPGGNIPTDHTAIELKLTFKEGGAPDFHSQFERIKERLMQAVETARESNLTGGRPVGGLAGINMEAVHLDQLPSYEASGNDPRPSQDRFAEIQRPTATNLMDEPISNVGIQPSDRDSRTSQINDVQAPSDAPPGYEEAQMHSVQAEMARRSSQGRE